MNLPELYAHFISNGKVTTDSRSIPEGSIFFGLKGDKFDGNAFAGDALLKGAAYAVVDDPQAAKSDRHILVPDVLAALQALARYHRDQLSISVIGLTGSNGKTTSKELVRAVLSPKFKVFATEGNLNNHIGVPLSILSVKNTDQIAVIEMGANHLGEIASLCEIANPNHGFITNISKAHVGMFGGYENILRAKSELYQYLLDHKGVVWINSNDDVLYNMGKRFSTPLFYPRKGDYYSCGFLSADPYLQVTAENGELVETKLTGRYNFENVAVALCIAKYFGVDPRASHAMLRSYEPNNMRSQIVVKGTNRIILDAYNANPASMKAAIMNMAEITAERKILILGDMFELGDESRQEHQKLGEAIKDSGIGEVYLCGPEIQAATKELPEAYYFLNIDELLKHLAKDSIRNATVLVKASRGMALERVMEYL